MKNNRKRRLFAPSILSADFSLLKNQLSDLERAEVDFIHCDVMDGHFVPNITFGNVVLEQVKKMTSIPLDVHLMINNVDRLVDLFYNCNPSIITVHFEASIHLNRTLNSIKERGVKAGVSINPSTTISNLIEILDIVDVVLIMSVNPGFGGQSFINSSLKKIQELDKIRKYNQYDFQIEVDGGINKSNISEIIRGGADIIVTGSALFGAKDLYKEAVSFTKLINTI